MSDEVVFQDIQFVRKTWIKFYIIFTGAFILLSQIQYFIIKTKLGFQLDYDWIFMLFGTILGIGLSLALWNAKLITEVRKDGIYVKYFPLQLKHTKIPLENLIAINPVKYNPLMEYGGWGIRYKFSKFKPVGRCFSMSGNLGVKLDYADGKHVLIGSKNPEELYKAIIYVTECYARS